MDKSNNSLENLAFVSTEVKARDVEINGKTLALFFRELPSSLIRRYYLVEASNDIEQQSQNMNWLVSQSLVDQSGNLVLTLEKALTLKPKALNALFKAAIEVNSGIEKSDGEKKSVGE